MILEDGEVTVREHTGTERRCRSLDSLVVAVRHFIAREDVSLRFFL